MFSRILTTKSIGNYSDQIKKLKNEIETADAIVIGARCRNVYLRRNAV